MQPEIILASKDTRRARAPIVSGPQPICGGCKTQFSRYTCPHCNLHYCSLPCFRSEAHSSCSETFDRKSLLDEIHSSKDKTGEEKKAMMEMLRKFEEDSLKQDEEGDDEDDEEDAEGDAEREELERKLEGVDLDALSPDDLLALLTPAQRATFDTTLQDPAKVTALVDAEFEGDQPWWENENAGPSGDGAASDEDEADMRPPFVDEQLLPPLKPNAEGKLLASPKLVYNVVAVLFAYAYTLRTFSLSSFSSLPPHSTERHTAIEMISQLVPFLVGKSVVVFDDVSAAVEHVVAREDTNAISPALLALLLRDVDTLLRPLAVAPVSSTSTLASHPLSQPLTALSDLHHLFAVSSTPSKPSLISRPSSTPTKSSRNTLLASQKLAFYIAFLSSPHSPIDGQEMGRIAGRIGREGERRTREAEQAKEAIEGRKEERDRIQKKGGGIVEESEGRPKIVEIL